MKSKSTPLESEPQERLAFAGTEDSPAGESWEYQATIYLA
jgi:hypothetical protein